MPLSKYELKSTIKVTSTIIMGAIFVSIVTIALVILILF